jgi:hypothetical protein
MTNIDVEMGRLDGVTEYGNSTSKLYNASKDKVDKIYERGPF